jgi:hypothetical protein
MKTEDIKQMFIDSAALSKLGPLDPNRLIVEERFLKLNEQYISEYIRNNAQKNNDQEDNNQNSIDWKSALSYLANIFQQLDTAMPESKPMNKAIWDIIAPAVQKFYKEKNKESK